MYLDWGLHMAGGKVFCIGNGESRKGFDLEKLRPHGTIYGCNAIYRDFMPDVLTAVDHGIMHEIYHAGVAQKIPCYFRDWTKVPAMTYEPMLMGGITNLEEAKDALDKVLITNERGDSQEYVMHGSKLSGVIDLIKREPDKFNKDIIKLQKKEINHATIKVSWIKEPDYSTSLTDIQKRPDKKDALQEYIAQCTHEANPNRDKINNDVVGLVKKTYTRNTKTATQCTKEFYSTH